ncbi:ammonium transporter [Limnospira fusiformis KN01]|uniref:Ammonium transporter n=3 Tax=Oscillatoriales TaxID=1150 RepID=A0A9P1NXG7_9CYAN|nr:MULTISPECIES: ammonium transporter [Limnospira]EKD11084.1 ammonium transporter [Arthrospira platensis C1]MDY7054880.1 ammonium transporter [Limnospira fusiformis LS22]QJB29639.1 ammonium transporter [Limnospira fusiformis SAG 85.79]SMN35253.1 Ammonium transporter [Arthrospira sp. SRM16]EDZ92755.1 ammonium transporter [Limnospira maxima CS-328]
MLKRQKSRTRSYRQFAEVVGSAPQPTPSILQPKRPRWLSPSLLGCIPLTALIIIFWSLAAVAQDDAQPITPEYVQGVLNTIWIVIASILVIFMNAGFGMLETGFCRHKNAVNILSKNLIVFAIATLIYWFFGFSVMFGGENPFIGGGGFFLTGEPSVYGLDPFPEGLPKEVFFLFQVAFAGTAATIVSGAVAERIEFVAFLIFSLLLVGISYPITGHWVWTDNGWLASMDFHDFAGSTVVHSVGGWAALMGAAFLGPRMGKYGPSGEPRAIPGHNMSIATLGCLILWIGWFGFNPGSELAANENVPYIALTTNLAASAGGVTATLTSWIKDGKPDLSMIINGILAGLVGITAGCDAVPLWAAVVIGAIAGVIVVYSVAFFDRIQIDDPVGATSVHLVCGIWGTLAVGIFGGANLGVQILGVLSIGGFTVVMTTIFWLAIRAMVGIRVNPEHEYEGLDIAEHGMEAYNGFLKEVGPASVGGIDPGIPSREGGIGRSY